MRGRRNAVLAHRDAPDPGYFFRALGRRQPPAMPGLGALADLEFDHLHLIVASDAGEFLRIEAAVAVAATEIARADLPDDVAAIFAVVRADAALAGVVREAALLGAGIERAHRVGTERAKAHRRDVEDRSRIWFRAIRAADGDAEFLVGARLRRHRMVHPFIALAIDVLLGAERTLVEHHLGALIDHGAGVAGKRHAVLLALEEVLPHLRPDLFEQKAQMRRDRIVAQHRVILLQEITDAEQRQRAEDQNRNQNQVERLVIGDADAQKQHRDDGADRQDDEARREWKHQRFHGNPPADSAVLLFFGRSLVQPIAQCCTRYPAPGSRILQAGRSRLSYTDLR